MKVGFIIIGAMKCATTSLAELLEMHPQVGFSRPKEPCFFSKAKHAPKTLEEYHNCFQNKESAKIYGEASTSYTAAIKSNRDIAEKIFAYNPDMKLIYMVRNPFDRIISQYVHNVQRGREKRSFDKAIQEDPHYISLSAYYKQIKDYVELFGMKNILIIDFDDFKNKNEMVLKDVAAFININYEKLSKINHHTNKSLGEQKLPPALDKYFIKYRSIIQKIPKQYRVKIKDVLAEIRGTKVKEKPKLKEETKKWIWQQLENDYKNFVELTGKERPHWLP
ncbi:MAG: sulfotransferase domain-containing protein [Chitinophagales bacterium]